MKTNPKLNRCSSRIRGEFKWKGQMIGEYEFLAANEHIELIEMVMEPYKGLMKYKRG